MNRVVFEKLNRILGMCVHWRSSWREREREREKKKKKKKKKKKYKKKMVGLERV